MNRHLSKIPALLATAGLLVTYQSSIAACAGATQTQSRDIHQCLDQTCPSGTRGADIYQRCTTWCCPDGGAQFDGNSCAPPDTYDPEPCCNIGNNPPYWIPYWQISCPTTS